MPTALIVLLNLATVLACSAQTTPSPQPSTVAQFDQIIGFEDDTAGIAPVGWSSGPAGTIFVDSNVFHSGHSSVRIERDVQSPGNFSSLAKRLPLEFSGTTVELRGFIRTENVSDFVALWMREDKDGEGVEFDNMQKRQLKGTTDWSEYSIKLPVHPGAQQLFIGALMLGTGKAWFDDLQLLVDGKPISQAPKAEHPITILDRDHQFDTGSRIALSSLTQIQVDNLVLLGKVWGYLKYDHPQATSGQLQWDYQLFRILPAILAAPDRAAAQASLLHWVGGLGPLQPCSPCAMLDQKDIQLAPDLVWLTDKILLGRDLSKALQTIQQNRPVGKQFYVSLVSGVQNPSFDHELGYRAVTLPDAGFQILALYRFWNIIEYWYPDRSIVGEDWDGVLREFLPRIALAKTSTDYQFQLMELIGQIHDTHANLWSSLKVRPPTGECRLPLSLRFIGQNAVVTSVASADPSATDSFKPGDVLTDLDGQPVSRLIATWSPYYADSNQAACLRDVAQTMTTGPCGPVSIGLLRDSKALTVKANRIPAAGMTGISRTHDSPGDTFRLLSDQVAYLRLSSVKVADIDQYMERAARTKGLIIDIRNYPSEFVVFALGSHLVEHPTPFAKFTFGDLSNPGAFHWGAPVSIEPSQPHYLGKVVVLVDEVSLSQAEYTTMAFRSSPQTVVIGSTTAGADGNVSTIPIPGGFSTAISGLGVFYPDGKPTQQMGIIPDKTVVPTIEGIRAGRDEVLEEAVRQILGADTPASKSEQLSKH